MNNLEFIGKLALYRAPHFFLGYRNAFGDLSQLKEGEFYSFILHIQNTGPQPFAWTEACVRVDGGPAWGWAAGTIPAGFESVFPVYAQNMRTCMTPGPHTAVWYFDGQEVHRQRFFFTRETPWNRLFPLPTEQQIAQYPNRRNLRSPYLAAWLLIPREIRFTEYQVDFRAGHLPRGTYCCLGQWSMDLSGLRRRYASVRTEYSHVHGYAGLQRLSDGSTAAIMSFWDIFCGDGTGKERLLRPRILWPRDPIHGDSFSGEGTGARCLTHFPWMAGRWYRMHLRSFVSRESGTTLVEQWVQDLETGKEQIISCYDTGIPDSAFVGNVAVFLENFLPETAGSVRSMEICNAMYRREDSGRWQPVTQVYASSEGGLPHYEGSYNFGVEENRLWMITSGLGGDWFGSGKGRQAAYLSLEQP